MFLNLLELLEFNIKLLLIKNAGLIYLDKFGSKLLETILDDTILIKFHRKLNQKYGSLVCTYIISKSKHYYILDPDLSKNILIDSPKLFSAGKMKADFFKSFMPNNVGISVCQNKKTCPWSNRRKFNENVLGTEKSSDFFKCIQPIVENNISKPLLDVDDFKSVSFKIISETIFGSTNINNVKILKEFVNQVNTTDNLMNTSFFESYDRHLYNNYKNSKICSLLHNSKLYKNDEWNIIRDQVPHWFAPFIFVISFLIPNLLCIILNFDNINCKIKREINDPEFDVYSKKTYLHYCVIEHIRLFNTININMQRTVNNDMIYHDINFKKGDQIFILFSSILRNEKEFNNPDMFIPERWSTKSIKDQDIVFGVGPQKCPSKQISPIYYKVIISYLLKNFKYESVKPKLRNDNFYFLNPYDINFSVL